MITTVKAVRPALKVVLIYLLLGTLWIYFSDKLLSSLIAKKETLAVYETYKGLCYVMVTSGLLYVLVNRMFARLNQKHDQLQKIMDQSPAVICTVNRKGEFIQISASAEDIWGYSDNELLGKRFFDFVHPDDKKATLEAAENVFEGSHMEGFINRYLQKDGTNIVMEWSAKADKEHELMYGVGIDATALKKAEGEIAKERNLLRTIIDNIPDYIFAKDRDRRMILSNKALNRSIYGEKSGKKGHGKTAFELFHPDTARSMDEDDKRVIENGELIINREETAYDANGNRIWLQTTKVPLRNQNNEIEGLVGITRNITSKKRAEDQIKQAKERYEMVMKATRDTVYDWDLIKNSMTWGNSFEMNYNENYFPDSRFDHVYTEDKKRVEQSFKETLEASLKTKWESEYRSVNQDGTTKYILERAFIIRDKEGAAVRMIGAMQDITELKQKEKEIVESLQEKEVLISEIHHRVKNNLAVMSGMMQLQAFETEDHALKNKLLDNVTRIQSMAFIHEQLYQHNSFSKLKFSENLKHLVKSIMNTVHPEKDVALSFKLEPVYVNINQAIPASLIVNEVITNILKHAFKGTDKGTIRIELKGSNSEIKVSVIDNGRGLPDNFDAGSGKTLGLNLIDQLAVQLEADYNYHSSPSGTTFSLKFKKDDFKGGANTNL